MPETNFRALCEELLQELCCCYKPWELKEGSYSDAMKRANAALAQPKPVAPTDEDLEDLAEVMNVSGNPVPAMRRALELWGNSQGILDSSPHPEPVAPTDEELLEMWHSSDWFNEGATLREFISIARAVLARWGTPANTTSEEILEVPNE